MSAPSFELRSEVFPTLKLIVDSAEYTLCYPISSVVKAEETVGHSLKTLRDWLSLETKHLGTVVKAGLEKFHSDLSVAELEKIADYLTPEILDPLHYALCKLAFPKAMAIVEERATAKSVESAPLPNEQGSDGK
jgi:hypothetical protein